MRHSKAAIFETVCGESGRTDGFSAQDSRVHAAIVMIVENLEGLASEIAELSKRIDELDEALLNHLEGRE